MKSRQRARRAGIGGVATVLTVALSLLGGCGSVPDDFAASSGSQFSVAAIGGVYGEGTSTNQVDVVQNLCEGEPEFYSDHFVEASFLNRPLPNATEQTGSMITLHSAEIRYTPLDAVTAPYPLPSPLIVEIRDNTAIPVCSPGGACDGTVVGGIYFIPIETKDMLRQFYINAGNAQLAYNVTYVFKGTNDFGEEVMATGQFQFYVANYDYCDV